MTITLRSSAVFRFQRIAIRSFCQVAGAVALLAATGCLTSLVPIPIGGDVQIPSGQGLLVIETLSNSNIESLRLIETPHGRSPRYLGHIPSGHQFRLVSLPEGNYRWSRIELPGVVYNRRSYPVRWNLEPDDQWTFSIKAGQVNYPGLIILHRSDWSYLSYRVLDRSGELLQTMRELYPDLLSTHAFRYGGAGRDDFLEFYQASLRSRNPAKTNADEEARVAPSDP